ncbi:MAG: hypothetical protein PUJ82_15210 [Spirochaetales bacterium]|nr:hypothetical protein [Spirochaetales bacterium]MDY5915122.1 hypothetical protein [Treponema sp.]
MKNKFIIFYTIFTSAVFAFAISLFGVNIYKEYSQGQSRANQRYNTLVTDIKSYNSIDKEISENSLSNIKSVLKDFNDFSFIQINLNNSEILKYPKDASADLTVSNLTKTFSSNFNTQNGQFEILCNMYLLRPSSIYYYAKISFIIILIVTIITIILIFYINSQEKQFSAKVSSEADSELLSENDFDSKLQLDENLSDSSSEVDSSFIQQNSVNSIDLDIDLSSESEQNKNSFEEDSEQISDLEKNTEFDTEIQQTDSEDGALNPEDKNNEDSQTENEEKEIPAALPDYESPMIIESSDAKENNDAENYPDSDSSESNPSGLFNPVTGLGWESYLDTRLENEINRAISSEIDISVFIINIPNLERESEESKKVSEYLSLQFQFKDLLFEYKNDCIVAIKISMNLDEALNFADKIHADISQILEQKQCYIGISTRSIRIVSGERLFNEALAAVEHAKNEEDSPIIAFRVDVEKYRQFLEQN